MRHRDPGLKLPNKSQKSTKESPIQRRETIPLTSKISPQFLIYMVVQPRIREVNMGKSLVCRDTTQLIIIIMITRSKECLQLLNLNPA